MRHPALTAGTLVLFALLAACSPASTALAQEPVVGLPCEGCDAIFDGMPPKDSISSSARIVSESEPGESLVVRGTVRDTEGDSVAGVVVYAYHTDAAGVYPPDPARHGRLRAWARTDAHGVYEFVTIRPGGYPGQRTPQHIHMHILEPGRCTYYIDEVFFTDDPRLTGLETASLPERGGPGVMTPTRDADGIWRVTRDITLGANIPGYPAR